MQVDVGSDEEQQLFEGLPTTEAALSAAERQARQQPLLALSKGHRQRRVTLGDDRQQYNDEAAAAAGGVPSPRWDLHSVAESMQQVSVHLWIWEYIRRYPPHTHTHTSPTLYSQVCEQREEFDVLPVLSGG